jgi:histidine triad (HIT) family protein
LEEKNMDECIFCKIAEKEAESAVVYEDDSIIAFRDINPAARVHVLIIPKKHTEEITPADNNLIGGIFSAAKKIAEKEGIDESGFRVLVNRGADAGQVVKHLHFHLLGGEKLNPL